MRTISTGGRVVAAAAALFLITATANAQDDEDGPVTQGDDAKYLSVTFVKFKAGQRAKAMEIIGEYFVPAVEKAGTSLPLLAIHFQTGKWDAAYVWDLAGGMADLEWFRSPDDVKWFAALAELTGGPDKADEMWQNYLATVATSVTEVGHHHVPEAD